MNPASAEDIRIPLLEDYDIKERAEDYAVDVHRFIRDNPDSKFIPRLCHDFYLAAKASVSGSLIKQAKTLLVMEAHPSLYSQHYISSIVDAKGLRALVMDISLSIDTFNKQKVQRLCELTRVGIQKYKAEIMGDDIGFPIMMYVHSKLVDDKELSGVCTVFINKHVESNRSYKPITDLLLSEKPPYEKYIGFSQLKSELGQFARDLYFDYLTEVEKSETKIVISQLNGHFERREFEVILKDIESLPTEKKNSANLWVLKAMALFALEQDQKAIKSLKRAMELVEFDSQKKVLEKYIQSYSQFGENKKVMGEIIPKFANTFLGGDLLFEGDVQIAAEKGVQATTVYLAMDLSRHFIEIQVQTGEELLFAYRLNDRTTSIYIREDGNIIEYDGVVAYPLISMSMDKDSEGGFHYQLGFGLNTDISQLELSSSKLFGSPYLSTSNGFRQVYDYSVRLASAYMSPLLVDKNMIQLEFGSLDWEQLKMHSLLFTLDEDYAVTKVSALGDAEGLKFNQMYLGTNKQYLFSPPSWPDKPVVTKGEFDPTQFLDLLGRLMKIFEAGITSRS